MKYAYFKGKIVPFAEAKISIMTHAFNYGTGVFEGIRGYWNAEKKQMFILKMREHYERLLRCAKTLKIKVKPSLEELNKITLEVAKRNGYEQDIYIRPLAYKSQEKIGLGLIGIEDDFCLFVAPFGAYLDITKGIKVCISSWRRIPQSSLPLGTKITGAYVNSSLAKAEALEKLDRYEEAIELYDQVLELNPEDAPTLHKKGRALGKTGLEEEALEYYNRYSEYFPDRPESFRSIGDLHKTMGNFVEAKAFYDKTLLLDPENIDDLLNLADIEFESGNFEPALKQYQNTLEKCKTTEERARVYSKLQHYYELRGEMKKALEYLYLKQDEWEKTFPPLYQASFKINTFDHYTRLESTDIAFQTLETMKEELDPLLKKLVHMGYLYLFLELKDVEQAENSIVEVESLISEMKVETLQRVVLNARGQIHELKGEYDLAVQKYLEQLKLNPTNSNIYINIGRCYRNLKNYNKAEDALQKALIAHPFSPDANCEIAFVYYETGKMEKALEHMKKTVSIWENADPDYEPALKAREKLAEWEDR